MKLFLLRHGDAVDASIVAGSDEARYLSERGRERVREGAKGMRSLGYKVDRIWTSPLPRALQTARITAEELGVEKIEPVPELRPGTDASRVLGSIAKKAAKDETVMLVGHNPDLEILADMLIEELRAATELKKGGLAIIESKTPPREGTGKLVKVWSPDDLIGETKSNGA